MLLTISNISINTRSISWFIFLKHVFNSWEDRWEIWLLYDLNTLPHPFSCIIILVKWVKNIFIIKPEYIVHYGAKTFSFISFHLSFYFLVFIVLLLAFLFSYTVCPCHISFFKLSVISEILSYGLSPQDVFPFFLLQLGLVAFQVCCSWAASTSPGSYVSLFLDFWCH